MLFLVLWVVCVLIFWMCGLVLGCLMCLLLVGFGFVTDWCCLWFISVLVGGCCLPKWDGLVFYCVAGG